MSVLQNHFGSEPNDRDGISASALSSPAMCKVVRGETRLRWMRNASARTNCIARTECFAASRCTQWTVGELSLKSATWLCASGWHMSSIISHSIRSPAISRSELVIIPFGFVADTMLRETSSGHFRRNTVGVTGMFSPTMTPPNPWPDASVMPMKSGHSATKFLHLVGELIDSRMKVRQSLIAVTSDTLWWRLIVPGLKPSIG